MLDFLRKLFTKNISLKIISLFLALIAWFYIVKELHKGSEEDVQLLKQILPSENIVGKKLIIKPIFIGKTRWGYDIARDRVVVIPEYCIVVGTRDMLGKVKYVFTVPIDVAGIDKTFTKSVPLNPIAPGVYMEETLVQVTVPVERATQK